MLGNDDSHSKRIRRSRADPDRDGRGMEGGWELPREAQGVRIENHRLVASGPPPETQPVYRFDEQGPTLELEQGIIAVIHYSVTLSAAATAAVLRSRDYVSCHVTVGKDGTVIQQVPFNRVAFHAGKSSYAGRQNVNRFSLGIEVSNPGPLIERDGKLYPTWCFASGQLKQSAVPWDGDFIQAQHKSGLVPAWKYWAAYSPTELDLCAQICALWRNEYKIKDVVGHDDISTGRKFDPGPAWPLSWLKAAVFPGRTP